MTTASDSWSPESDAGRPENKIGAALFDLLLQASASSETVHAQPEIRGRAIALSAARRAAAVSGALALPPGPLGMLTIVPDLVTIWKIQQQMVVDIAATYGRRAQLRREVMVYCLFKHGSAALVRDLVVRVGERVLVREASLRAVQQILKRVGVRVTQQMIGRSAARWIPLIGAIGTGAYAYYDTKQVAATALDLFARGLDDGPPALPAATSPNALPPSTS